MIKKRLLNLISIACLSLAPLSCTTAAQNESGAIAVRDHETLIQGNGD